LLQVVTGTFSCGQQLVKYGYKESQSAHCVILHMKRMEAAGKESCQRQLSFEFGRSRTGKGSSGGRKKGVV
jgi:hypothetical protein